jgi:cytochrome c oxidase subunit IV
MWYERESNVIVKEIDLEIWMDLHVLSHPEYEKMVFGMLGVYMYALMCVLLVLKNAFFVFSIQELIQ